MSTFIKNVSCLGYTVYQDSISLMYSSIPQRTVYVSLLESFTPCTNKCKRYLIKFYVILFATCTWMMVPCGLKHVGILSVKI